MILLLFIASALLILCFITPYYLSIKGNVDKTLSVMIKASGTMFGVLFGFLGVLLYPTPNSYLVFAGLCFGLLGDILLESIFYIGGVAFFLGNVLYVYSMLTQFTYPWHGLVLFFLFSLFLFFTFKQGLSNYGTERYLAIPYGLLIAFMASTSITYILYKGCDGLVFGFGTFLFAVSDYLLAYRICYKPTFAFNQVSLSVYYLAQLCIGVSLTLPYH